MSFLLTKLKKSHIWRLTQAFPDKQPFTVAEASKVLKKPLVNTAKFVSNFAYQRQLNNLGKDNDDNTIYAISKAELDRQTRVLNGGSAESVRKRAIRKKKVTKKKVTKKKATKKAWVSKKADVTILESVREAMGEKQFQAWALRTLTSAAKEKVSRLVKESLKA